MPMKSNTTMDHLSERIRDILGNDRRVTEKNMFGGLTFLLDGRILVGCKKDGRILLSVGRDHSAEAITRPGATPMRHNGREMTGFVWVDGDAIEDDDDLEAWVTLARRWVSQLPPKAPPASKKPAASGKKPAPPSRSRTASAKKPKERGSRTVG
jgi:TfoX/Sxy family transcriptional regulator of competence genes